MPFIGVLFWYSRDGIAGIGGRAAAGISWSGVELGGRATPAGDNWAPPSPLIAAEAEGLGDTADALRACPCGSTRGCTGAGLVALPSPAAWVTGESATSDAREVRGAGDSTEPPLPPTCIVIFFEELGVSALCPTLILILGWAGSGT